MKGILSIEHLRTEVRTNELKSTQDERVPALTCTLAK